MSPITREREVTDHSGIFTSGNTTPPGTPPERIFRFSKERREIEREEEGRRGVGEELEREEGRKRKASLQNMDDLKRRKGGKAEREEEGEEGEENLKKMASLSDICFLLENELDEGRVEVGGKMEGRERREELERKEEQNEGNMIMIEEERDEREGIRSGKEDYYDIERWAVIEQGKEREKERRKKGARGRPRGRGGRGGRKEREKEDWEKRERRGKRKGLLIKERDEKEDERERYCEGDYSCFEQRNGFERKLEEEEERVWKEGEKRKRRRKRERESKKGKEGRREESKEEM